MPIYLFENVRKYKLNDKTFKISLYFDFLNLLRTDNETKSVKQ